MPQDEEQLGAPVGCPRPAGAQLTSVVWDIGRYSIVNRKGEGDDDNDSVNEDDDEDDDGAFEEAKLRHALKVINEGDGEKQSFHIILHGQKLTNHGA